MKPARIWFLVPVTVQTILACPYYDWKGHLSSQPAGSQQRLITRQPWKQNHCGKGLNRETHLHKGHHASGRGKLRHGQLGIALSLLSCAFNKIWLNVTAEREIFSKKSLQRKKKKGRTGRKRRKKTTLGKDSKQNYFHGCESKFYSLRRIKIVSLKVIWLKSC